ncbi:MAG: sigma-70 family RNA polymerase sigma factor [Pirellulaceae bacterium]|jgi:RNA polymerase sigma factor (TIGR02999 family)|nr:sigma-70 family RNA polymerase sigma factor [Pirellulaceae bacterium]MDP6557725.1 sigma-70 family RNA polymerase sigma factor [Pirellulaceae bacterium]MDP6720272.1 sigma-70 family RNA polymerase sigma factor [Pirellulaceae bacterium]
MDDKSVDLIAEILSNAAPGQPPDAEHLIPLVYDDLRDLAANYLRHETPGHTLQPTALVNEAFLKLVDQTRVNWQGRTHFFAVGAKVMRRILVDHARAKQRQKRGGDRQRIGLRDDLRISTQRDEDLLAVDEAIAKLAECDLRQAKIVEMRFFGGLTVSEVAEVLGVSKRTVEAEWTMIRAWLRRELSDEDGSG